MSLWSSFRRFSRAKQGEDSGSTRFGRQSRSRNLPSLKHRDLRLEQFEQRLLLSVTPNQDYLDAGHLNVAGAWNIATGHGQDVAIALLDDGVQGDHGDVSHDVTLSYDFMTDAAGGDPVLDTDNHGTAIAGIIASAPGGLSTGIADGSALASYRLTSLDPDTPLDNATLVKALGYGLDDIDIFNVGFNYAVELYDPGDEVIGAMRTGVTEGRDGLGSIYTYGASGADSNYDALANSRFSIAVGALDADGNVASAPGTATLVSGFAGVNDILTTDRTGTDGYSVGGYTNLDDQGFGGSQAAAAQISGVIALMLEANPTLTYRDVQQILVESSSNWKDDNTGVYDQNGLGWGTVDAQKAVEAARDLTTHVSPEAVVGSGTVSNFDLVLGSTPKDNYVESSVDIASSIGSVEWAEVTLYGIPGDWAGNQVTLRSPSGEESVLSRKGHATSDGSPLAAGWTFTTAAHWGEASGGEWTLKLENERVDGGPIGTWGAWDLKVYGQENAGEAVGPELVKIIPNAGGELIDGGTLSVAPRELLFQFNENQTLDQSTFANAIDISPVDADPDDEGIKYTTLPGDNANQIIVRFAEILPDDTYEITIKGAGDDALMNVATEPLRFNNGSDLAIRFDLDLGAQVVSVVPQPVFRDGFKITTTELTTAEDGQIFTVSDGFKTVTFELNANTRPGFNSDHVAIDFNDGLGAVAAAAEIVTAINNEFDVDMLSASHNGVDPFFTVTGSQAQVTLDAEATALTLEETRTLAQAAKKIDVYFNDDDLFFDDEDPNAPEGAVNPTFYQLHRLNTNSGVTEEILIPEKVFYDAEEDKAQLVFSTTIPVGTYRLDIGSSVESHESLSVESFDDAINVGSLWNGKSAAEFDGYIGDRAGTDVDLYRVELAGSGNVDLNLTLTNGFSWDIFTSDPADYPGSPEASGIGNDALQSTTIDTALLGNTFFVQVSGTVGSYHLELDTSATATVIAESSSFANATTLGVLGAAEQKITGEDIDKINSMITVQPGGLDEPGHRHILPESHFYDQTNILGSGVINYQFPETFTTDNGTYINQITPNQKQRAREIFEIYSEYLGVEFRETTTDPGALIVATGDLRSLGPYNVGEGGILGLGNDTIVLMDHSEKWVDTFGGTSNDNNNWFETAIHEIGHALGLSHDYDLPEYTTMGTSFSNSAENTYPGDADLVHGEFLRPNAWNEIDLYQFTLSEPGKFTAETVAERDHLSSVLTESSDLDTQLVLYRETTDDDGNTVRRLIAQNDDYFSNDSMIQVDLDLGTYYVGVMSAGMEDVDPTIPHSGFGGTSTGLYDLKLRFEAEMPLALEDTTETVLDGDADGVAGGTFQFWFEAGDSNNTVFVDKAYPQDKVSGSLGSLTNPYTEIDAALDDAHIPANGVEIIRVIGNADDTPYLVGKDNLGSDLEDGALVRLPEDVTMMIDAGAVFKLQDANFEIGTSAQGISREHAALQVLGTPYDQVHFRSYHDDLIGGDSDGAGGNVSGGDWGGLVFRSDSDYEDPGIFLNSVAWADIQHGGGKVTVDSVEDTYTSIHLLDARPTIAHNMIQYGSGAAISADLASFEDTNMTDDNTGVRIERAGPDVHGNTVLDNSINGLFVRIPTDFGKPQEFLETAARWDDTDIVHVVTTNLLIHGTPGGPLDDVWREDARLQIDPAIIVKLSDARIHTEIAGQLIAEGLPGYPVVFTSLKDDTYGMAGGFDTGNDDTTEGSPGDWGGLVFAHTSKGSLDYIQLSYGGGEIPFNGDYGTFNPIEIHQAEVRLTNSIIELNADGDAASDNDPERNGMGTNAAAAIFVRGAQPVIVNNTIIDNQGDAISINANSLDADINTDWGRSTGRLDVFNESVFDQFLFDQFNDNYGPLIRLNTFDNTTAGGGTQVNGMNVRAAVGTSNQENYTVLTVESIWDDTDVVHVLRDEIQILNQHTFGGLRLQSSPTESLVVKLQSNNAGFTANGTPMDVEDRIGGTIQVLGTSDYPVILTSIDDNTAAAGFDLEGAPQGNTGGDGTPDPGAWQGITIDQYANARNVAIYNEIEPAYTGGDDTNNLITFAQFLGELAPDQWDDDEDDEKGGDDNLRLGFEVQGNISLDAGNDVDIYSFKGIAGSEVWIDIDRTSHALDAVIELIDANGDTVVISDGIEDPDVTSVGGVDPVVPVPSSVPNYGQLKQNNWQGDDFYTNNKRDPGFYAVLPGDSGTKANYFIRVSSQNDTSGRYQMQVRLRQTDEEPGSTVRYADIRYATRGIEVLGHPARSILAGETAEQSDNDNDTRDGSQYIGNLLESDLATISLAGEMATLSDVDWYRFEVDQEYIQRLSSVNAGGKTWSTVFDIDYADGIGRADTVLAVYRQNGSSVELVYLGQESNIEDDQPGTELGAGLDNDDLSRGSFGELDPFIGPVHLPATNETYYVAVSSNYQLPAELRQYFEASPPNPDVRLEPVNSVTRIVEDHIGFSGHETGDDSDHPMMTPVEANGILPLPNSTNLTASLALSSYVVPYTLSDVVLFVSGDGGDRLRTINPFTGEEIVDVGDFRDGSTDIVMDDIAMRSDGTLYGERHDSSNGDNSGNLYTIDTGDVSLAGGTDDGLTTYQNSADDFGALAFRDMGTNSWEAYAFNNNRYDEVTSTNSNDGSPALWRLSASGVAQDEVSGSDPGEVGDQPVADRPTGTYLDQNGISRTMTNITGMEFIEDSNGNDFLYLVDDSGNLWQTRVTGTGNDRRIISGGWNLIANFGQTFTGLTLAPQNLDIIDSQDIEGDGIPDDALDPAKMDGVPALTNILVASTAYGLHGFDTSGNAFTMFDTDDDGRADSDSVTISGAGAVTGLAFSPLDFNLWHPTANRRYDNGHGVNDSVDNSRDEDFHQRTAGLTTNWQEDGGASFYFGLEEYRDTTTRYDDYINYYGNRQYGILSDGNGQSGQQNEYHDDLTYSSAIGGTIDDPDDLPNGNYNLPGGAFGSLITGTFDLAGSVSADKPTLYFNYFLDTENAESNQDDEMRDSARVWVWGIQDDTYSTVTAGGNATDRAKAVFISPDGENDFEISLNHDVTVPGYGNVNFNNLPIEFIHQDDVGASVVVDLNLPSPPGPALPPGVSPGLFVTYERGVSTAKQIKDAIEAEIATQDPVLMLYALPQVKLLEPENTPSGNGTVTLGYGWHLLATNNSGEPWDEIPHEPTISWDDSSDPRQRVQELFDADDWRQARVDLGQFAGQTDLKLRFDFSTAGRLADDEPNLNIPVNWGGSPEPHGDFEDPERGQNNNHEGFYIDDIIIGYVERGEMVTASNGNNDHFVVPQPNVFGDPPESLVGEYQLEIRRGTEYANNATTRNNLIALHDQFDTNQRFVAEEDVPLP